MLLLRISIQIVFISYFACLVFCSWIIWKLHCTGPCYFDTKQCFENYLTRTPDPLLKLWVYSSTSQLPNGSDLYPVWELDDFNANESFTKDVTVRLPLRMHYNGTMFIHVFLSPPVEGGRGAGDPFDADWYVNETGIITHTSHQATTHQITNDSLLEKQELVAGDHLTTTHWRSHLTLNAMTTDIGFASGQVPDALKAYFRPYEDQYLPMLIIDDIYFRSKDLLPLNNTCDEMPLTITYTPVSFVTIFLRTSLKGSINLRRPEDSSEEQIEMDKDDAINNVPGFILSLIIGFHFCIPCFLLSVLCDISFWQERRTMGGLSSHTVVWNSVSLAVLFLEVTDEVSVSLLNFDNIYSVALLVFVSFVSTLEIWRMFKVFQPRICWTERRLVSDNADVGDKERETQAYDAQAMRCLSYVLYPAWVAVIIYTLQYNFQKSWYSLCIQSLANGFRYLGFLFVLPQVFINYKLKSVADLPWKALTYRALTSFAIDICHVISPSSGGKVSFPYEVFFVIYLYQRGLYSH